MPKSVMKKTGKKTPKKDTMKFEDRYDQLQKMKKAGYKNIEKSGNYKKNTVSWMVKIV